MDLGKRFPPISRVLVLNSSDLGGVIDIADPVTGTFVFIKLGYLKNFMSNKCSMKCLWASENQRNWIFDIIY